MPEVKVNMKGGATEAKHPKRPEAPKVEKALDPSVRRIIRVAAADLDGTLPLRRALRKIRGVGFMLANAICISTKIDSKKLAGTLNEEEVKILSDTILNQAKNPTFGKWMLNRRNDPETGVDVHLVGDNLIFKQREDINMMKRMRCRRGIRHELGLSVRGQHTKSTGRKGRGVGVIRKTAAAAAAPKPTAAPAAKPGAKK